MKKKKILSIINILVLVVLFAVFIINFRETIKCSYNLNVCRVVNENVFGFSTRKLSFPLEKTWVEQIETTEFMDKLLVKRYAYWVHSLKGSFETRKETYLVLEDYIKKIDFSKKYYPNEKIKDILITTTSLKSMGMTLVFCGVLFILIFFTKTKKRI